MKKIFLSKGVLFSLLIAVCSLLIGCASSPIPAASRDGPVEIYAYYAGISHAGFSRTQREFDLMNRLGVRWTQGTFDWIWVEPEQGEWDFLGYDAFVDANRAAGIRIVATLAYGNWWLHDDLNEYRNITPEHLPYFLNYVRTTVEHFYGRVDAWKIWNEPNFSRFWRGTDEDFFELTRRTVEVIREIDSEAIIIGGSFNRNVTGLPERMIRGLFESGAMENVDFVAFHPYELNPARASRLFERFRAIVADYGFADRIWITEMGFPTGGWYPHSINERRLPRYVIQTKTLLLAGGAEKILWYQLFDPHVRNRRNSENFFGIVRSRRDHTSKGAEAFRLTATYFPGTTLHAQIHEQRGLPRSLRTFWFDGADHSALVLWKDGMGSRRVRLELPGTDHRIHDIVTGEASPMDAETVIRAGRIPVFITWQGSNDKPIITAR